MKKILLAMMLLLGSLVSNVSASSSDNVYILFTKNSSQNKKIIESLKENITYTLMDNGVEDKTIITLSNKDATPKNGTLLTIKYIKKDSGVKRKLTVSYEITDLATGKELESGKKSKNILFGGFTKLCVFLGGVLADTVLEVKE